MTVLSKDRDMMRHLAERIAHIASLPHHREREKMWCKLNDLGRVKPLIWIYQIPWHEMDVNGELTLQTTHPLLQELEREIRQRIYQWEHMPGDMVVSHYLHSPLAIEISGFGINEDVYVVKTDESSQIISRHFKPQIHKKEDLEKIKIPEVIHHEERSDEKYDLLQRLVGDILPVRRYGIPGMWFAPWDELIRWWGVDRAMMDMIMRPDLVHQAMERLIEAYLSLLQQLEEKGLLELNTCNISHGSGGYGYTEELPFDDFNPDHVRTQDIWGSGAAQIFSHISPAMHEEFALHYELQWLTRFGLTYYGCCDPLHHKIDMLKKIPNLRKISISPWANLEKAVEEIKRDYVLSYKPNPAIFAQERWDLKKARQDLREVLEKTRGSIVEIILKDISTVNYEPQRLWEWESMARELTREYA